MVESPPRAAAIDSERWAPPAGQDDGMDRWDPQVSTDSQCKLHMLWSCAVRTLAVWAKPGNTRGTSGEHISIVPFPSTSGVTQKSNSGG
jgi:hypothetical protein